MERRDIGFSLSVCLSVRPSPHAWVTLCKPLFYEGVHYSFRISHTQYIILEVVPRQGFSLIDQKLPELQAFKNALSIFFTLCKSLSHEGVQLQLSYFPQVIYETWRCATSRFQFDRSKIDGITRVLKLIKVNLWTSLCASHFLMKAYTYTFYISHTQYIIPEHNGRNVW